MLDALAGTGKMNEFGKVALTQCLQSIENKEYLAHLLTIDNIKSKIPELYRQI